MRILIVEDDLFISSDLQVAFVSASKPSDLPHSLRDVAFIPKPLKERAILQSIDETSESFWKLTDGPFSGA